jgi:Tfp pilus assembly protein PilX
MRVYYKISMSSNNIVKNESGLAAFMVTSFIIIILSIVVLGFSQNTRREQRQALDRQLSSQAFYTAESAANETAKALKTNGSLPDSKNNCSETTLPASLDIDNTFSYSCVTWDKTPTEIKKDNVDDNGVVYSLQGRDNSPIRDVTIKWKSKAGNNISGCESANISNTSQPNFNDYITSSGGRGCDIGLLRLQLIPYEAGATRDILDRDAYTVYVAPTKTSAEASSSPIYKTNTPLNKSSQSNLYYALCSSDGTCQMTIEQLPIDKPVFIFAKSYYRKSDIEISGRRINGSAAEFQQAQHLIDVTARANDIVKRVKVYADIAPTYSRPGYAVQSVNGICKNINVWPTGSEPSSTSSCR